MTDSYPLDRLTPARHVATELDRVAPAALSIAELVDSYMHPNPADLTRVKEQEYTDDPIGWLIWQALDSMKQRGANGAAQILHDEGKYRLAEGININNLRFEGKKLTPLRNDHAQLRAPFDPMTGKFSENVRRKTGKDSMDGLRESMREFGWIEQLPAIKDERGVVIIGHRRLAVAQELGIDPVVVPVEFGDGDEADAKRFRLAIASNLDAKPFTPEERKDIAEYLYGEREWVMESIGKALGVSQRTISNDLRGLSVTDKPSRPKGGRPKKTSTPKQRKSDLPELRSLVGARLAAGESVRRDEVAKQFNVATGTVDQAVTAERERIKIEQGKTETEQSHVHRWACAECGQPLRAK